MTLSGGGSASDMSGQTVLTAEDVDIDVVGEGDDGLEEKDSDGGCDSPAGPPELRLDEADEVSPAAPHHGQPQPPHQQPLALPKEAAGAGAGPGGEVGAPEADGCKGGVGGEEGGASGRAGPARQWFGGSLAPRSKAEEQPGEAAATRTSPGICEFISKPLAPSPTQRLPLSRSPRAGNPGKATTGPWGPAVPRTCSTNGSFLMRRRKTLSKRPPQEHAGSFGAYRPERAARRLGTYAALRPAPSAAARCPIRTRAAAAPRALAAALHGRLRLHSSARAWQLQLIAWGAAAALRHSGRRGHHRVAHQGREPSARAGRQHRRTIIGGGPAAPGARRRALGRRDNWVPGGGNTRQSCSAAHPGPMQSGSASWPRTNAVLRPGRLPPSPSAAAAAAAGPQAKWPAQ
uniref:Uncharacterized protein n=1 Tax=Rhinopithecus bieti TaxID=61621 RepID=A0A2K6K588_RHIBE